MKIGPIVRHVKDSIDFLMVEPVSSDAMQIYYEDHYLEDALSEMLERAGIHHRKAYKIILEYRRSIQRDHDCPI